jgi:DNA polymerase III sliding clamp (beta) subunit (PCNA family)
MASEKLKAQVNLPTMDTADHPVGDARIPDDGSSRDLPWAEVARSIRRVAPAVALQSIQYAMTAMHVSNHGEHIYFAGTDTHRLHISCFKGQMTDTANESKGANMMLRAAVLMADACSLIQKPCALQHNGTAVIMHVGPISISGQCIQGRYPKYRDISDQVFERDYIFLSRDELIAGFRHVSIFGGKAGESVFSCTPDSITVSHADAMTGDSTYYMSSAEIPTPINIVLVPHYMLDALNQMTDEMVHVHYKDARSPIGLMGSPDFACVVMPIAGGSE